MKYALFSVPVGTIYDLPQTIKEGEAGLSPPSGTRVCTGRPVRCGLRPAA